MEEQNEVGEKEKQEEKEDEKGEDRVKGRDRKRKRCWRRRWSLRRVMRGKEKEETWGAHRRGGGKEERDEKGEKREDQEPPKDGSQVALWRFGFRWNPGRTGENMSCEVVTAASP